MTNETAHPENGVAHTDSAAIAAMTTAASEAAAAPTEPVEKKPSFDDLGLHPDIKQALDEMGYFEPTAVQTAVYKPVSEGKDLMVQSRTGTGKTTAFGLPTLSKIVPTHRQPQALILAPTRELALQVARELTNIGKHRGIVVEAIYGGAPIGKQITNLQNGVHVIVGTPGRVLDHIGRRTLDCKSINTFILDECDEMLSMGFLEDIERVVSNLPEKKQTLLFSATMPDEVTRYSRRYMTNPENISLSRDQISVSDIHHAYYIVSGIARSRDLLKILYAEEPESAIIFCNMRDETTAVARFLNKQGLDAEPLSSDLSQADRERVMNRMKAKNLRYLCATDVAARGIDISNLSHVINYSVPESPEIYVHRTGRTGRAGRKGVALSMVGPRELGNFRYVRLTFGIKPEERLLPKDSIFEGKIKVPLPPVGLPQPPDPVQILIRGTPLSATGPSDLEMKIFEKLYATQAGKKVLATLVAERLDKISTRNKPRERPAPRQDADAAPSSDAPREDRPRFDRDGGGDRPRFDRDGGGGDRPRRSFDGDRGPRPEGDRGDRPRRFDRDDRGPRRFDGDRPNGDRGPRPEGDRGPRPEGDRGPRPDGDRPRFDADRGASAEGSPRPEGDRGPRPEGERERRPWRDRNEGGGGEGRRFDRDRNRDRGGSSSNEQPPAVVVIDPESSPTEVLPIVSAEGSAEVRTERSNRDDRGGRDRDRDRGGRGERVRRPYEGPPERERGNRDRGGRDDNRDRGARTESSDAPRGDASRNETLPLVTEAPADVAPVVVVASEPQPAKVDDVARAALDKSDRKGGKRDKKAEPTAETREFWETWAEEKSARPAPASAAAAAAPAAEAAEESTERGGRSRGGRGRGGRDKERTPRAEAKADAPAEKTEAKAPRAKRESAAPAAAAASDASQARLFVSLGKKHGVSANDLRGLLAGPIGGDKARIGSVSLRDSHAHVRVPEDVADAIISGVSGTQHNEHDVTVERARA